jgi:hypothetical protein
MAFFKKVLQLSVLTVLISALICCGKQDSSTRPPQKIDPFLLEQPDLDGHGHRVGSAGYRRTGWTD